MSGLIEKDIRILLKRKQILYVFVILAVVFSFSMEGSFIIGYLPFLAVVLCTSTIAYDEMENGYTFLLTLPTSRAQYVKEKFIFGHVFVAIVWALAVVLMFAASMIRHIPLDYMDELMSCALVLPMIMIILNIMLAFQIRFGAEKSRLAMAALAGIVVALGLIVKTVGGLIGIDGEGSLSYLDHMPYGLVLGLMVLLTVIVTVVAYMISKLSMDQKEL